MNNTSPDEEKMKILLIMVTNYPDSKTVQYHLPTAGIMYISSFLKESGFSVDCFNCDLHPVDELKEIVQETFYDVIGLGGMYFNIESYKNIIQMVRKLSEKSILVLGGQIATAHPEFALKSCKPDFLVIGEGELIFSNLIKAIGHKRNFHEVAGIAFIDNNQLVITENGPIAKDLNALPFPDREGFEFNLLLNTYPYNNNITLHPSKHRRVGGIIGGRGCPSKCTFCFQLPGTYRLRTADSLIKEVGYLVENYKINDIHFLDDLFCIKKEKLLELCKKIKPFNVGWRCSLRVNGVDEEMLFAMKDAGCYQVAYGLESGSQKILKSMKKGIKVEQIRKAIFLTRKAKMTVCGIFIFGDPQETFDTAKETLKFSRKSKFFRYGKIIPYPGSEIFWTQLANKKISNLENFYRTGRNEDGSHINMTALTNKEYAFLLKKIYWEKQRIQLIAKICEISPLKKDEYKVSAICPLCKKKGENLIVTVKKDTLKYFIPEIDAVCPHCYQRMILEDYPFINKGTCHIVRKKIYRKLRLIWSRLECFSPKLTPLFEFIRKLR